MSRGRSRTTAALFLSIGALPCAAGEAPSGFNYCAPPFRPACVDGPEAEGHSCDSEVQAFVATVFKYRFCLERESERAVRDANDAIEQFKCRTGKLKCR